MMTDRQARRQNHRDHGQYAKVNQCNVCGKSSGEEYLSHPDTDNGIADELICLCGDCFEELNTKPGQEALDIAIGKADKALLKYAGMMGHCCISITGQFRNRRVACETNTVEESFRLSLDKKTVRLYSRERKGKPWRRIHILPSLPSEGVGCLCCRGEQS